jgi:hypothetical protein
VTALLVALALAQAPLPQVGDTIWLVRTLAVPAGRIVRVVPWNPEGAVEALGPGVVVQKGDSVEVRYPAVGWLPGSHAVQLPGPVLVSADGTTDSLPPTTITVTIASLLPATRGDSLPPPQPPAAPILRPEQTALPVLACLLLAALVLLPVHYWWRRRGRAVPAQAAPADIRPPELPVDAWVAAGEARAVLAAAAARLRAALAAHPAEEGDALLDILDDALFGPGDASAVVPQAAEALALADRLTGGPRA